MKKTIFLLLIALIISIPQTSFAMNFSAPTIIGNVGSSKGNVWKDDTTVIPLAGKTEKISIYVEKYQPEAINNVPVRPSFRGFLGSSTDKANVVPIKLWGDTIYEVTSNSGKSVYIVAAHASDGFVNASVFGKFDGKFVKYVDGSQFSKDGNTNGHSSDFKISTVNDKIIFSCGDGSKNWECILTWDEDAQWFGIETKDKLNPNDELISKALNATYPWEDTTITVSDGEYTTLEYGTTVSLNKIDSIQPVTGTILRNGIPTKMIAWAAKWHSSGTGVFSKVMIAMVMPDGSVKGVYTDTIGDRVKILNIRFSSNGVLTDYLDRSPGQARAEDPTVKFTSTIAFR
nr:hypothetical protein [uncultured Anaeromusa sp.]